MSKSGLADSPLFKASPNIETANSPAVIAPIKKKEKSIDQINPVPPRHHATMPPINHATSQSTNHDTMPPRHQATTVEVIRSALKEIGKEAATYRLTQEEKKWIEDLIYEYKRKDIKTSANEITRIAINFILQEHKQSGNQSILALVINALNR